MTASELAEEIGKTTKQTKDGFSTTKVRYINAVLKTMADLTLITKGSSINITNDKWGEDFEKAIFAYKSEIMGQKDPDTSKVGEDMLASIKSKIKSYSFSSGGMVSELQKVASNNGDDAWTTVKRGEDIFTPL